MIYYKLSNKNKIVLKIKFTKFKIIIKKKYLVMNTIDLNCDMGEGFGQWKIGENIDEELMKIISSSNIATGFHAGDPNSMMNLVRLAKKYKVKIGVHPGYQDKRGFGRRFIETSSEELINDIIYQIGALREFSNINNLELQHIKLHGALYMEAAKNQELSNLLISNLQKISPKLLLYCMDISKTYLLARKVNYPTIREFFADRDYDDNGAIVFTKDVGLLNPEKIAKKCLKACKTGLVKTVSGNDIKIKFETICFHSDTTGALKIGKAIKTILEKNSISISAPKNNEIN